MSILRRIWAELRQPTIGGNWYVWALIALGHVMLGALAVTLIPVHPFWLIGAYLLLKEARDLMRGGKPWDSLVDTGFFALGTAYGAAWMPAVAFLSVSVGVVIWIMWADRRDAA